MTAVEVFSYLCLDHFHPLLSESADDASDVHLSFAVSLLQGHVQGNERPRSPHPSTAVYQDRPTIRVPLAHHTLVEGHEGCGILRNAVIGPRHKVVLRDGQEVVGIFAKLGQSIITTTCFHGILPYILCVYVCMHVLDRDWTSMVHADCSSILHFR